MTIDEIIRSLEDQAQDKDKLAGGDPDSIFTDDASALIEASKLLAELAEYRRAGLTTAEATAIIGKNADLMDDIAAAKRDIAAILWLEGQCHYCKFAQKVEYSGASRLTCSLGSGAECRPEWRGRCQTCP